MSEHPMVRRSREIRRLLATGEITFARAKALGGALIAEGLADAEAAEAAEDLVDDAEDYLRSQDDRP